MADRYLLESGAPDGYQLEDGSGVLLLEGTGFDPANGFPYSLPEVPRAHFTPRCATALLLAAAVIAPPQPYVDPSLVPSWLPNYPTIIPPAKPRAPGLRPSVFKPPDQFGAAVRFVGSDQNNGLEITSNMPGPTNFTVSCFFYAPALPVVADSSFWMLQDTHGSLPASYINAEVTGSTVFVAWNGGFVDLGGIVSRQWYFIAVSVGAGGNGTAYLGKVGSTPTSTALTGLPSFTPASFTVGTDYFDEPFDGRLCSMIVKNAAISSGEVTLQSRQLAPVDITNVQQWWELKSAATKLVDSSGFGRNLSAIGAGSWSTEEGPFLAPGPWDSQFGPFQFPPDPRRSVRSVQLADPAFVQLVQAAAAVSLDWLPVYPERFRSRQPTTPFDPAAVFALDTFSVPPLGWAPSFPDRVRSRAVPALGSPSHVFAVDQFAVPAMSWAPLFPDRVRALRAPTSFDSPAVFALDTFSVPPLGWAPSFPERVRGRAVQAVSSPTYVFAIDQFAVPALSWGPVFPDRVRARAVPTRFEPPGLFAIDTFAVPDLSWAPAYPDRALRRARGLDGGPTFVQLVAASAVALDWLPTFPDRVRAALRPIMGVTAATFAIDQFATPELSWAPLFPERVRSLRRPLDVGGAAPTAWIDIVAATSWLPTYPDRVRAQARPPIQGGLALGQTADLAPALSWLPTFADRVRALSRPVNVGGPALVQLVAPVIVTPLSWAPVYPVMVWRKIPTSLGCDAWVWVFDGVLPYTFGGSSRAIVNGSSHADIHGSSSASISGGSNGVTLDVETPTKAIT